MKGSSIAKTEKFPERKLISSYETQPGEVNGQDSWGPFLRELGALDGWMLARAPAQQLTQASAPVP